LNQLCCGYGFSRIDLTLAFVICSNLTVAGSKTMTRFSITTLLAAAAVTALATAAVAEDAKPTPWVLSPDMAYGYGKDGNTLSYKMGTNNAGLLLKGAKKVPRGTLFFIGHNGQLYLRTGPYLEGDGKFMFGSD
jgi:hypothetical protein